jgi:hypothetical protein
MTSLGPDWPGKTVPMLWHTRFAASTHPILLRMGPQCWRFRRHCFGINVTVCAELLLSWSPVPSLHRTDAASVGNVTTLSQALRQPLQSHARYPWERVRKIKFGIIDIIFARKCLLRFALKHAKLNSLTTQCQPACHNHSWPDNSEIGRLQNSVKRENVFGYFS